MDTAWKPTERLALAKNSGRKHRACGHNLRVGACDVHQSVGSNRADRTVTSCILSGLIHPAWTAQMIGSDRWIDSTGTHPGIDVHRLTSLPGRAESRHDGPVR